MRISTSLAIVSALLASGCALPSLSAPAPLSESDPDADAYAEEQKKQKVANAEAEKQTKSVPIEERLTCGPAGTYEVETRDLAGDTGYCVAYANKWAPSLKGTVRLLHVHTLDAKTAQTMRPDVADKDVHLYDLAAAKCEMRTPLADTVSWTGKDLAGKDVAITMSRMTVAKFEAETMTMEVIADMTSSTPGAQGFPCKWTMLQIGKRTRQ